MKSIYSLHISSKYLINIFIFTLFITSTSARRCQPGTFRSGTSCSPCPIGTWQDRIEAKSCQPCPSGQTTWSTGSPGRDLCTGCPRGTYLVGTQCRQCPSGTTTRIGATSISQCLACGPGTELNRKGTKCEPCPVRTFSSDKMNDQCTFCPFNLFSARGSKSIDACQPVVCPAGKQHDGNGGCRKCREGSFKAESSSEICESCPQGTTSEPGSTECTPCPPGTFNEFGGAPCRQCGPNTTSRGVGATVCRRMRGRCPIDSIEKEDGACVRCDTVHRVNPMTGFCERCPPNSVAIAPNATKCMPCSAGMTRGFDSCMCPSGHGLVDGKCVPCKPGTSGSTGSSCDPCSAGTIAPERGAPVCRRCPAGLIASEDHLRCVPCPEGTALNIGPRLELTDIVGLSIDECRSVQTGCPIGYRRVTSAGADCLPQMCRPDTPSNVNCRMCLPGRRPVGKVFDSLSLCLYCPDGTTSDGLECRRCPKGMVADPDDGSKCICGMGTGMKDGQCRGCLPGTLSTSDDDVCLPCPAGTFESGVRSDFCENCPADTFSERPGSGRCEPCPAGTFTYGEGETRCLEFIE